MKLFAQYDLIARYNRGDPAAFNRIYDEYYPVIYTFVRRFINAEHDAKDIVTDTFLKLLNPGIHFENQLKLKAFLYLTAKNACFDYLKHIRFRQKFENELLNLWLEETENLMEAAEDRAEIQDRVRRAIEGLPDKCRLVFILYFTGGLKNSEIAARLKISEKTVSNQRSLAVKLLKITILKINNSSLSMFMAASWYADYLHHFFRLV
jgi:RNA polymerase sigma-70 factor (ECF subfamily)